LECFCGIHWSFSSMPPFSYYIWFNIINVISYTFININFRDFSIAPLSQYPLLPKYLTLVNYFLLRKNSLGNIKVIMRKNVYEVIIFLWLRINKNVGK
jgi:hypothetical protein